jgi:hypothetical protein
MKIRRPLFFAVVAATAVSLASIAVSAGAAETPFKGTVNGDEIVVVTPPTASVARDGTGTATYLGRFTERITLEVDLATGHATGLATFTAANGATLTASVDGQATQTSPTTLSIEETYTITGGTGRFADATGTFMLEGTVDQGTGLSSGTLSGAIDH